MAAKKQALQFIYLGVALLAFGIGQALLVLGRDFVDSQQPVDWAHWLFIVGAVGAAWAVSRMSVGRLGQFGRALLMMGTIAFIGMAAIDFLSWAMPPNPVADDAFDAALSAPAIAIPFLLVGPALFFIGLAAMAIEWWRFSNWGVVAVIAGTFISGYGQGTGARDVVVASFALMLVGLAGIWMGASKTNSVK